MANILHKACAFFSEWRNKRAKRDTERLPIYAWILYGVAAVSLVVLLLAIIFPRVADGFQGSVAHAVRCVTAWITYPFPFSLAEFLIYLIPVYLVLIALYLRRREFRTAREIWVYIGSVVSVFSIFFSLFVFSFGTGYHTTSLPERMGFSLSEVSAAELADTAEYLIDQVNVLVDEVEFGEDGFSVMPYPLGEMNERILVAFDTVREEYPFIKSFRSRIKPVLASRAMTYTHITGVYSYYTGEANLNVHFPDYTLPFTAAHELSHQRGIAREEEANFTAFLVTSASEDPYLRYVAYLNLFEYVATPLYRAAPETYFDLLKTLDARVLGELRAYADFFEPYKGSTASKVSDTVNDSYLKLQGNEAGTASYGLVVDLAVAYLKERTS